MSMNLAQAPIGRSLRISHIAGSEFASRLSRMGLYEGAKLLRINGSVVIGPVKVRGLKGDAILSGWLAGHIVIHLDNDHRLPLLECQPRDSGHVEGITGQNMVEDSLAALGIVDGDRIEFVRRMPPMSYAFAVKGKKKTCMSEALASHVLGETAAGTRQFSSVGVGEAFVVNRILPGEQVEPVLASMQVEVGAELALTSVSVSHDLDMAPDHPIVCVTRDGMRLYFREEDAAGIMVVAEAEPSPQVKRLYRAQLGKHFYQ